jgi:hypothetical protein
MRSGRAVAWTVLFLAYHLQYSRIARLDFQLQTCLHAVENARSAGKALVDVDGFEDAMRTEIACNGLDVGCTHTQHVIVRNNAQGGFTTSFHRELCEVEVAQKRSLEGNFRVTPRTE